MLYLSPLSDKASIKVKNNKNFTVETVNNSNKNIYIQGVELNGKPYYKTYIMYDDIMKEGPLKFSMGNTPHYHCAADTPPRPKSVY